jgi:tyrosine aminotransferase
MIHGANTLAQSVIPALFAPPEAGVGGSGESSPEAAALRVFREEYRATLEGNAAYVVGRVRGIPGLRAVEPQGAMYVMIGVDVARFPGIADDVDFAAKLLHEENIVVLPGQCFGIRDYVRVVFAPPRDVLAQAFDRIQSFCERHAAPAVHPSARWAAP